MEFEKFERERDLKKVEINLLQKKVEKGATPNLYM